MLQTNRATWRIAWENPLYRAYRYLQVLGWEAPTRENLCHFVKAVVIAMPWYWFWNAKLVGPVRPFMVAILGVVALLVGPSQPRAVILQIWWLLPVAGAAVLLIVLLVGGFGLLLERVIVPRLSRLYERAERWFLDLMETRAFLWFWTRSYLPGIYPWTAALVGLNLSLWLWFRLAFWFLMFAEIYFLLFHLAYWGFAKAKKAGRDPGEMLGDVAEAVFMKTIVPLGMVFEVLFALAEAIKNRFCPFIEFEPQPNE